MRSSKWSGNYKTGRLGSWSFRAPRVAAVRSFTAKGLATRERIVDAASALILEHGVDAAKLEDIQAAAHVSASQLYHYFEDKSALILAVIDHQTEAVLGAHRPVLERLDSFEALEEWRDLIVESIESQHCIGGCPLGSLVGAPRGIGSDRPSRARRLVRGMGATAAGWARDHARSR